MLFLTFKQVFDEVKLFRGAWRTSPTPIRVLGAQIRERKINWGHALLIQRHWYTLDLYLHQYNYSDERAYQLCLAHSCFDWIIRMWGGNELKRQTAGTWGTWMIRRYNYHPWHRTDIVCGGARDHQRLRDARVRYVARAVGLWQELLNYREDMARHRLQNHGSLDGFWYRSYPGGPILNRLEDRLAERWAQMMAD